MTVPIGSTHFPDLAVPSLIAQLRKNNYDVDVLDFNIDFLREIYTASYLKNAIEGAREQYNHLKQNEKISHCFVDGNYEDRILALKYDNLDDFFRNHLELADKMPLSIEKAVKILKTETLFYNPKLLQFVHKTLHYANKIACLPYAPFDPYNFDAIYYEDICKIIFDKSQNIYMEYFESKMQEIKNINPAFVGISVSYGQQLVAALTLAYLLKKNTNAHICIGGNYFSRLTDYIPNYKDFFNQFVDSISYGEGEFSIVKLAKYIEGEIEITEVPQLIYMDKLSGEIAKNKKRERVVLSKIQIPDYSDFDLDKYLLPEKILPLQVQRGCYWNKCAFCSMTYDKTPSTKNIDDVIKELKYNKEKYNVSSYFIVDESITPEYLEKLSDKIISSDLNIKIMLSLRLEKKIDYNFLKKLYKAGIRSIWWGIESASRQVLKDMNKGINIDNASKILKVSDNVGISNFCLFIHGFPTATYEEDLLSVEFLKKNSKYIHNFKTSKYMLVTNSEVYENPQKYNIEIMEDEKNSRVSLFYDYKQKSGMSLKELERIEVDFYTYYDEKIKYVFAPLYHFLYCNKYGLKQVKSLLINQEEKTKCLTKILKKILKK